MSSNRLFVFFLALLIAALVLAGCQTQKIEREPQVKGPDYSRPLPPGASALRLITDPAEMPDLSAAFRNRGSLLLSAIDQSQKWFMAPSSRDYFPYETITHEQAQASLYAMEQLLESAPDEAAFLADFHRMFDVYKSIGCDDEGTVLFTGYYSPIFNASRQQSAQFSHPLYTRPADLVTDPKTGHPQGRMTDSGQVVPYYTRKEIEESNMFAGTELVWLEDALSAYIVHVNGSAKLRMLDGSVMYVGYAGKTDRPYRGLGKSLLDAGVLQRDQLSLKEIKRLYKRDPQTVEKYMNENECYVFFTEYAGEEKWPAGSLGVRVTQESSLATDKAIYPRGGILIVDTQTITFSQGNREFVRFMLDQDTGGAIRAPGRADIYMGIGPSAEILAGGQYAEGELFYIFLKPEYVNQYAAK